MPGLDPQEVVRAGRAQANARKQAGRQQMGQMYDAMMGAVQDPQDHPANNVSHPHGNRNRPDATIPLNVPQSIGNTKDYEDGINY